MRILAILALLCLSSLAAIGQPRTYPQFRNLSGLAGSGYGVDMQGYRSLSGPVAYSTPVAHTLGRNQFEIVGGTLSFTRSPSLNPSRSNGTGVITFGTTLPRLNIAGSFFVKSNAFDQVFNVQTQYIPSPGAKWVFSLGIQDIQGRGGSAGEGFVEDEEPSQSVFGVVTYRWDTRSNPIYVSAGFGTRRFGRFFCSASYQLVQPLRLWIEGDGFGVNFGVLGAWRLGHGRRSPELSVLVGLVRNESLGLALGIGF